MKTVRITIPNYPFIGDVSKALANRDDAERMKGDFTPIPKLSYPSSGLKTETATQAFINGIIKLNFIKNNLP